VKKVKSNCELFERSILMKANEAKLNKSPGFTIVELLTVMGVIAILIGLLVPALSLVKDYSKEIQQKAQFHSVEVGLGMYKTEFGSYPPSNDNRPSYDPAPQPPDTYLGLDSAYGGANKLAETMVGLDMLGFHPASGFRADNQNKRYQEDEGDFVSFDVYHAGEIDDYYPDYGENAKENVDNRKGPYIDLENANAFKMSDVYEDITLSTVGFDLDSELLDSLVLCDVYTEKRPHSAKKTGAPILYYKARVQYTYQDYEEDVDGFEIENDIYYYPDNQNLLELGMPSDQTINHALSDGTETENWQDFENMILNTQVTSVNRPYCADSYILISAGKDGMYGTADDIFNFEKE
jgi:type II secretory pathway pseudopilin PulG